MNPRIVQILIIVLGVIILGFGGYQAYRTVAGPATTPAKPKVISVKDYVSSPTAMVKLTVIGPITATEKHVERTITINQSNRQIEYARSYSGVAEFSQSYSNNPAAFADFMTALQNAGFVAVNKTTNNSEVGACPSGSRYIYELSDSGSTIVRSWSSSCGSQGTFDGVPASVRSLFERQIPDINKIPSSVRT